MQDDGTKGDESPSSSNMISFELSNGDPYGPHVPMSTNDERFVEYQLEDLTGFPSCAEEEERVSNTSHDILIILRSSWLVS